MKIKSLLKEPWPRIIGIPVVSLLIALISYSGFNFELSDYLLTILFTAVMWNGDYFIIKSFRTTWPSLSQTPKRIVSTVIAVCGFNLFADYLLCTILAYLGAKGYGDYLGDEFVSNISKNFVTTMIIGTLYETGYFFGKYRDHAVEIEQVKSQQLKSELNVLKNQISPHFLFNSLNTLVTLIHENQDQAANFTEKLSQVYRYILQYKDKEIIKLKTEMDFIDAYNYLLKMRFESCLEINTRINPEDLEKYVAPLTVQMLIENAVKHNVVSLSSPLGIDVYVENGSSLIVRNNLQRKTEGVKSLKTGLENIRQRYKYLSDKEVDVIETREHFMVALPLIEVSPKAELVTS